jgi:acyl carrier protein
MVFEKVRGILFGQLDVDEEDSITLESKLEEDLNMTDDDWDEIADAIEEEFSLNIDSVDAQKFVTVADLVNYITANT